MALGSTPWIVGGDFNQILHPAEHSFYHVNAIDSQMAMFRDSLLQAGLFDLRFQGTFFTWTNKQPVHPLAEKLDRLLANSSWVTSFPHSTATFLAPLLSDHCPCLIDLAYKLPQAGTYPFKFQNYLTKHPEFHSTVEASWIQAGSYASNLHDLYWKQRLLKKSLKTLYKENFSKIQIRVSEINCLLQSVQVQALQNPCPHLFLQEKQLHEKWCFLRLIEEAYFKQKSRINWLKEGDFNTNFFHRVTEVRASYNTIRSFLLDNGVLCREAEEMSTLAVNHFKSILAPDYLSPVSCYPDWIQAFTNFCCSPVTIPALIRLPTAAEITTVLFKLNPSKSPGPDGLTSGFYKASWDVLGPEVLDSIIQFFRSSFLPAATNATILTLVPKKPGATRVSDYRPISCCNTIYKTISKILVARLKPFLPEFILPNQTAFVKGRLLVENTILASEIVNGYDRNKGPKRLTIKVDIAKAFDTVRWDFIINCLCGLGFPNQYIRWIETCISTANFTVGYNGTVQGHFKSKRGIRQGDPLSPYLFVLVMNGLSHLLNNAAEEGQFHYHHKCSSSKLTHLCFADDLLIFAEGSILSVQKILSILSYFEHISGLALSVQKTSFYTAGVSQGEIDLISFTTGLTHGHLPIRYLGVPLSPKKLTMSNCEPLIQQIKNKVNTWSARSLSFAGRLVLLNTVIAGISNFWCATFVLPKECLSTINSICAAFLWKGTTEGSYSARVSWHSVTHSKEEGGLGIRNLAFWNQACILKLIWLLFFQSGSVWVAWYRSEVLQNCLSNFWTCKTKQRFSWLANKLIKMRGLVFDWIKIRVGNGRNCRFWTDNWAPMGSIDHYLANSSHSRLGISSTAVLADLKTRGLWRLPPARTDNQVNVHAYLSTIQLSDRPDTFEWMPNGKLENTYSTKAIYELLKGHNPVVQWKNLIWNKGGIPRHSFLSWLFILNRCPTRDRLIAWGLPTDPMCLLCGSSPESRNHLFFECGFSWYVWKHVSLRCTINPSRAWQMNVDLLQLPLGAKSKMRLSYLCWQATIYSLWAERNSRLHRQAYKTVDSILKGIDLLIRSKIASHTQTTPRISSAMMQLWLATPPTPP